MRILAGAVVRQHPEVLAAHLKTMLWQDTDAEVDLCYVNDLDPDEPTYKESRDVLYDTDENVRVLATHVADRPPGAEYVIAEDTHRWELATFAYLAQQKQRLLDLAVSEHYDKVFLVDTDLLAGPETLGSLLATDKPIVSAVFWTAWQQGTSMLPQVWQQHPYKMSGKFREREFLRMLGARQLVPLLFSGGLGACTLIDVDTLKFVRYWPFVPGLPTYGMWQGEDRHFCVRANRAHIPLWADAWPDVWHCYRPSDRQHIPTVLDMLYADTWKDYAVLGDYVSFRVDFLQEPGVEPVHVRGRLGEISLMPEIEADLQDLRVGEACTSRLHFPTWFETEAYAGQSRTVLLTLLGVKTHGPHIGMQRVESNFAHRYYTPAQLGAIAG